ncbi:dihydroorotase [Candidatus Sumerlaeota bacterium]|nr:dihydroorotase [Candidatus Sumerlaeota bacterium]
MSRLLVRNGTVVDPSQGIHRVMDVLVENGRVAEVRARIDAGDAEVVEAAGFHVAPGFIDIHTHLREPGGEGSETIETGTRAAAAGGFTRIYCMPNTTPVCDSETGVQYVISRAASHGCINVVPVASITKGMLGEELTNFGRLMGCGAGAFSDDGRPVMNAEIMRRALEYTKLLGVPLFEHCEDMNLTAEGHMNEGVVSARLGIKGIPRVSESVMVSRNCALAAATGGHLHVCHVSTRESVHAIREARRNGVRVTAEVSPHHLTMTEDAVLGYNTNAKMKPPLCEKADRDALIEALEDGTIDCIATDHAPHSSQAKDNVFDAAPFGIIGLETAFPVLYTTFVTTKRWTLDFLVEKMTTAPAKVMNADWGTLRPGTQADFSIIELGEPARFERRHIFSKSINSPWIGATMKARIAATFVNGLQVFQHPDVVLAGAGTCEKLAANGTAKPKARKGAKA